MIEMILYPIIVTKYCQCLEWGSSLSLIKNCSSVPSRVFTKFYRSVKVFRHQSDFLLFKKFYIADEHSRCSEKKG